jgi:membrane protein HdeD
MKKSMISLLAIILGIIIIAFPMVGIIGAQAIIGVAVLLMGVFLLITGISEIDYSPSRSIATIIIGILILILGLILLFSPTAFAFLAALTIYLAGILLIIVGLVTLIGNKENRFAFWSGVLGIVLGVIYIILGTYAQDPIVLGALIGIWLLLTGILRLIDN